MGFDGMGSHPAATTAPKSPFPATHHEKTQQVYPSATSTNIPKAFPPGQAGPRLLPAGRAGLGLSRGWVGSGLWDLPPPWGCASLPLAGNSLLVFPGTLARFHLSCLVFLANSCRVKLFNNIFSGLQAAGETEPRRCACLCRFATWGRPRGEGTSIPEGICTWELQGMELGTLLPAGMATEG